MKSNASSNWLFIPSINKEVEIEVHDKNKSWDDLVKQYPNFEEQLLTKEECELILKDKEASKTLKMDGNSRDDDFFIQQFNQEDKKNGYVAVFFVYWDRSVFFSDRGSRGADGYRGVRFCRKKNKDSKNNKEVKELKLSPLLRNYEWSLDDFVTIKIDNCDNYEQAFDKLSKFILEVKAEKILIEKGKEIYE